MNRADIRHAVGDELDGFHIGATTAVGAADGSTMVDATRPGGDNEYDGDAVLVDGEIHRVSTYASGGTFTLSPSHTSQIASGTPYELIAAEYPLERIHRQINTAIGEAYQRGAWVQEVDDTLFGNQSAQDYPIPAAFKHLYKVEVLEVVTHDILLNSNGAWDELVDVDVVASRDTEIVRENGGSAKFVVGAGLTNGDIIATDSLGPLDLTGRDAVEFWFRVSSAVAAGDLQLLIDDTAECASPLETLNLPAAAARTWVRARLTLVAPELLPAVISVGLKYAANAKANTIWTNRVIALTTETAQWRTLDSRYWQVNRESRALHMTPAGRGRVADRRVKLIGWRVPAELDSDDDEIEIDGSMIVHMVLSKVLSPLIGGPQTDIDNRGGKAALFRQLADADLEGLPTLPGVPV